MYSDEEAAALYNTLNPWGPSDDFYLDLAMSSTRVLDVGCGTGTMLHRAREAGHSGRLVGIDPDAHSLAIARRRTDVEWLAGKAASISFVAEFELAMMMSHAFQCLVTDDDLRDSLAAVRRALAPGGRFVFETRNPANRAWQAWAGMDPVEVVDPSGQPVRISYDVLSVDGDVITYDEVTSDTDGRRPRADRSRLRFLDVATLTRFLTEAGFAIDARYGGWDRRPLEADSAEIVISARGERTRLQR